MTLGSSASFNWCLALIAHKHARVFGNQASGHTCTVSHGASGDTEEEGVTLFSHEKINGINDIHGILMTLSDVFLSWKEQ